MDERQTPEVERPKRSPVLTVVTLVIGVVAVVGALYVVAKNLKRVSLIPASADTTGILKPMPPDTGLVGLRATFRGKAHTLAVRCRMTRRRLQDKLTPPQDSLSRECDSAIAALLAHVAALDSVKREDRKAAVDSLKAEYERAKAEVNVFSRSGLNTGEVSDDSLDAELKKLISE
jgi:hypothetical protein